MSTWKINLKFADGTSNEIELYDAKSYFNGYLKLKRSYFYRLVKAIKITKKYTTGHAIEKVLSPDSIEWTLNPWMLLLVKDNEKKNHFGYLLKERKIYPDYLLQLAQNNSQNITIVIFLKLNEI